jgi:hypothetical protein
MITAAVSAFRRGIADIGGLSGLPRSLTRDARRVIEQRINW